MIDLQQKYFFLHLLKSLIILVLIIYFATLQCCNHISNDTTI